MQVCSNAVTVSCPARGTCQAPGGCFIPQWYHKSAATGPFPTCLGSIIYSCKAPGFAVNQCVWEVCRDALCVQGTGQIVSGTGPCYGECF